MVATGEFSFNGLTIGGTTVYPVQTIDGLGAPATRLESSPVSTRHGAFTYARLLEPRTVTIEGTIVSDAGATLVGHETNLRAAFQPQNVDLPLSFMVPGDAAKRVNCVPTNPPYFIYDRQITTGMLPFVIQLMAGDPRIYADTETTTAVSSGGSTPVSNGGSFSSPPIVETTGAYSGTFTVTNSTQSKALTLSNLTGSGTITINFAEHTVMRSTTNLYDKLTSSSIWWDLQPGSNTIASTGVAINVKHRAAWI